MLPGRPPSARRPCSIRCFVPLDREALPTELTAMFANLTLGLPEEADVPELARMLVHCFYKGGTAPSGLAADGTAPDLEGRSRTACKGLHWRIGTRLRPVSLPGAPPPNLLAASLETSLLIVLREVSSGQFVACAELSLQSINGRLPGEFAIPALFQLHACELGAYLSNVAVLPTHRRRGLASRLLRVTEWIVRHKWQYSELYLHLDMRNEPAVRLYAEYDPLPQYDHACRPAAAPGKNIDKIEQGGAHNRYHRRSLTREVEDESARVCAAKK